MTQNIYGLTRNTRPRGVQFILSGSKQFRKNGGPPLKGSRRPRKKVARHLLLRRPKVVFFGGQAEKNRFFFFPAPSRYGVRRANNFSTPPQKNSAPTIFFAPHFFFGGFFVFSAPKTKNRLFRRAPNEQYFSASKRKNLFFFFSAPPRYGVRRPNNVFDPPKIFCGGFFFLGAPKNRRFLAPKTKNRLFRRASKEQRPKSCILGSTTTRASGGENCPSRFERVPGFSWNPSGGSTKASNEGFMKPP